MASSVRKKNYLDESLSGRWVQVPHGSSTVKRTCLFGLRGKCGFLENKSGKWPRKNAKSIEEVEGLQAKL